MNTTLEDKIKKVLNSQKAISFAYLYGSFMSYKHFRDIDIAIFLKGKMSLQYICELKVGLSKLLNIPPDIFDIRILNDTLNNPDAFLLLFLERILKKGELIVNKNFKVLGDFLEKFSNKYRDAEALLNEVNR